MVVKEVDDLDKAIKPDEGTLELLNFFSYQHLEDPDLRQASSACAELANGVAYNVPNGREKTAGMRKLLEAKDCFVRAVLAAKKKGG